MASLFGHAIAGLTASAILGKPIRSSAVVTLGVVCAVLPDADVISFALGIPYESFWGHRGFTHSFLFAVLLGCLVSLFFYKTVATKLQHLSLACYFTACTASHSILDAMTTGGHGVAFFSPWDNSRYFLPWRPIKVSPLGVKNFISERGMQVLSSEFLWITLPCLGFFLLVIIIRRLTRSPHN